MVFLKFCDVYAKILNRILTVLGVSLIIAVSLQIAGRYVPFIPLWLWPLELTNFSLIWAIFIGSVVALRDKEHFNVDIFTMALGEKRANDPRLLMFFNILYYFIGFSMTVIFTYYGYYYFLQWGAIQVSDITGINLGWLYISVPLAGVSWAVFLIEGVLRDLFKITLSKEGN